MHYLVYIRYLWLPWLTRREPASSVAVIKDIYFMLKRCLQHVGERLSHAYISSFSFESVLSFRNVPILSVPYVTFKAEYITFDLTVAY
jgi:hypothetical protein